MASIHLESESSVCKTCIYWRAFKEEPQSFSRVSAEGRWTSSWHHPAPPEQAEREAWPLHPGLTGPPISEPDTVPVKHRQVPENIRQTNDKTEVLSKQMFKSTIVQKTKSYIINNEYSMSLERDRFPHIGETQKRSWGVFVSSQLFWFYIFTHNELVTYALPGQAISLLTVTAVPSN